MIRLSKEQKKCHECGASYVRLYQYLNHVSDIDGCGKNASNLNALIKTKSNDALCKMHDSYVLKDVEPPMLLSLYVEGYRLRCEHDTLTSNYQDLSKRHKDLHKVFKKEVKVRVAAEIEGLQQEVDETNEHLRSFCGTMTRLYNRGCIPSAYQIKPEELTAWNVKGLGNVTPEQFSAMCSACDYMPSVVFHRCIDLILGSVSPPMIAVANINKRKFLIRENDVTKEESMGLLMVLLKDISEKIAKCIREIKKQLLKDYRIARTPYTSNGLLTEITQERLREIYDIEMGYHIGNDPDAIHCHEAGNRYEILFTALKDVYLFERSRQFNQEVTMALAGYVRTYMDLLHLNDSAVINRSRRMHLEFTGNNKRYY